MAMDQIEEFLSERRKLDGLRKKADSAWSEYCLIQQEIRGQEQILNNLYGRLARANGQSAAKED